MPRFGFKHSEETKRRISLAKNKSYEVICYCGTIFKTRPLVHWKYCSQKCYAKVWTGWNIERNTRFKKGHQSWNDGKTYRTGPHQDNSAYKAAWSEERKQQFSEKLHQAYALGLRKSTKGKVYEKTGQMRQCGICQKAFYTMPYQIKKVWCSEGCYWKSMAGKANPKHSQAMKKFYVENPDLHPNRIVAKNGYYGTRVEKLFSLILEKLELPFETQFYVKGKFGDFRVGNTIIEVDGKHWHRNDTEESIAQRDSVFRDEGYEVIHISDEEVYLNNFYKVSRVLGKKQLDENVFSNLLKQAKTFRGRLYLGRTKRR